MMPLMRARVVGVDWRADACSRTPTPSGKHGRLTREFGVTYRDTLQPNERRGRRHVLDRSRTPATAPGGRRRGSLDF